jgi:hypothetical protein
MHQDKVFIHKIWGKLKSIKYCDFLTNVILTLRLILILMEFFDKF